jgi:hypothetical protein
MTAGWLQDAFRTFEDVGEVEIRRHHLRAGPHDSRGRCGCHINDCSAFRAHERERGNRVSIEYRIEARKIALSLAASAMNQSLDGPRRIDGEGMWPAANPAAAETVQRRVALPEVGVAPRAPLGKASRLQRLLSVPSLRKLRCRGPSRGVTRGWELGGRSS